MKTTINDLSGLSSLITAETEDEPQESQPQIKIDYHDYINPRFAIVSRMAYLLGVGRRIFDNENESPQADIYDELDKDKYCRIIRNLCILRNAFENYYSKIQSAFRHEIKNIGSLPEYIPQEAVNTLSSDGCPIYKSRPDADEYIIQLNIEIRNRIDTVAFVFPEWINWNYIKPLFVMENGTKPGGIKNEGYIFNGNRARYPYQVWLNWSAFSSGEESKGNILYNDEKFVTLLYEHNEDRFTGLSFVRDAGNNTMHNLNDMLDKRRKVIIVVDCDNSDPVKLAAALSSLSAERLERFYKILLFDSERQFSTPEWKTLVDKKLRMVASAEIEHIIVDRVTESKSQVGMTLAMRAAKEVYTSSVDGIILFSSDSDYWAMIKALPDVSFLVMLENGKTGNAIVDTLMNHDIPYCFIDEFCTAASYSIKTSTLTEEIQSKLDAVTDGLNLRDLMTHILETSWIDMTYRERDAYYERYLKKMKLVIAPDGAIRLKIE